MAWSWALENADGQQQGRSENFDNRSDAESWVGEAFEDLLAQGVDQVRLFEDDIEVYGPMSLHADG